LIDSSWRKPLSALTCAIDASLKSDPQWMRRTFAARSNFPLAAHRRF
jgi:hypothetical protein